MKRRLAAMQGRRGSISVMMALAAPVLLGLAGMSIDMGFWYRESMRLQLAADAAAMGGARLLAAKTATTADFQAAGLLEARAVTGSKYIGTLTTPISVSVAADWSTVTVTLSSKADSYFTPALRITAPTLTATATAGVPVVGTCILALNQTASPAIKVDNMGNLTTSNCGIFSDSAASTSIYLNSGTIKGTSVGAVGGVVTSNSGSNTLSPSPGNSNQSTQSNPYQSLQAPSYGACNYTNASFTSYGTYNFTQSQNVFCGNTVIGGNGSTDSFAPGVYYVVNGSLAFANAIVTQGSGITFILTGSNPGGFYWVNNNSATLSAPTTGATAGILLWQTCSSSGTAGANVFDNGSTLQISGSAGAPTIYAPCGSLTLQNNAQIKTVSGANSSVVANSIYATGSAGLVTAGSASGGGGSGQISLRN